MLYPFLNKTPQTSYVDKIILENVILLLDMATTHLHLNYLKKMLPISQQHFLPILGIQKTTISILLIKTKKIKIGSNC